MGLEDTREDNLDTASREEAVAVVPPGEVEVKKMENYDDFLVHGARKSSFNSGFATDVVAGDIDMAQSQVAVAGSVNSTAEAPVSAGAASSADVDTGPASSSEVVESREKVESKDLNEAVEESAGNNGDSKPNFAEDGTREFIKTQASSDLIADAPTSAASVQDSAEEAAMSVPPADVEEKAVEVSSEDAEVVSEELSAEVARREEVSSKILDEGSAEKRDSEASVVPVEEVKLVAQATTPVNRNEAITTPEAAPPRSVDVQERCAELDFKDAGALNDDVSPQIEDSGSAKNDDSEALTAQVEENQEITDAATCANPDEDASSLEVSIPPSVGDGEESVELGSKDVGAVSEGVSPSIVDEGSTEKGDSESPSAPLEAVEEVEDASTRTEPDEHLASLNAVPSPSVDAGVKSIDLESNDARAPNEDISPLIVEGGSAEIGESEAPEAAVVEVHGLAEATISAALDDDVAGLEAAQSPSTDVGETSVKLDSEDVGAVSDDVRSVVQDEESADKGNNDAPVANISAEPDEAVGNLDAEPPPSVLVGVKSVELDSEGTRALNTDAGPRIEEEVSAEKGDADAAEAPLEEVHDVAAATSSVEADPDAAGLEAPSSPPVDVGDKSVELNSEGAGAESEDDSLKSEGEGSAKKGDSTGTEAPAKEVNESAGVAPSVDPEEDAADLDAPPSRSDGLTSVEADAEDAGTSSESGSPKVEDEGSAAEKGESEEFAPPEEVNEVAEPVSTAEPLEAAPSPIANVEEKSFELDPDVSRAVSEDVSPEVEAEGLAAEKGESEATEAPVEEVHEVAEAATSAEPLEASLSPLVDVEEKPFELSSEVAHALSVDASPKTEAEGSAAEKGESKASAPPEEVNEVAEPTSIAEPLDAASSPPVDVGDKSVELNSESVEAESKNDSLKGDGEGSAKKGDSIGTEAPAKEVNESAGVAPSVELEKDAASLDAPSSHSDGLTSVEADAEGAGKLNENASPKIEDEGSAADKGESEAPVPAEEVNEVAEPKSMAEPLEAVSSPFADVEEKSLEPDPKVARVVREDASPEIEDEGLVAEKGESEALEAPLEQMNEVAEADPDVEPDEAKAILETVPSPSAEVEEKIVDVEDESTVEAHPDAASMEAAPSPSVDAGEIFGVKDKSDDVEVALVNVEHKPNVVADTCGGIEEKFVAVNAGDVGVVREDLFTEVPASEEASPNLLGQGSAEMVGLESPRALVEEVQKVAEAATPVEGNAKETNLDAVLPRSADVEETSVGVDSEDARVVSEDVSPGVEDEGWAEKGDSAALESPIEVDQEVTEATTIPQPDEDEASVEAAPSPSVNVREASVEGESEDPGALNEVSSPLIEAKELAEKGDTEAAEAPVEEVQEVAGITSTAEPDVDAASVDAALAPVVKLDSEVAGDMIENVSPKTESVGLAEEGDCASPEAPVEEINDVAEATTTVVPDEAVASLEAAPPPSARALNEDISPTIEEGGSAEKDDSEAREAPLEEIHVAALASSSVEAVPDSASVEAAPSPSVDPNCEDAGVVREDLIPKVGGEGLAEKVDSAAPEVPAEESHEVAGAAPIAEREEVGASVDAPPSPSVDVEESPVHGIPEGAGDLIEDVNPIIEDGGLAELSCSEAPAVPGEEVHNDAESVTSAAPNKDVAILEAALSSSVDIGEEAVELDSEDARAVSADVSPATKYGRSTEGSDNPAPEAPLDVDQEVPVASTSTESDEVGAGLEAETLPFVVSGGEPLDVDSEDAGAVCEDVSPQVGGAVSAGTGEGEAPEAHIEEVQKVADATTTSKPDEDAPSLETANLPSAHLADTSVELNSEDSGAVSDDISPVIKDEGWAEKGGSAATEAPADGKHEVAEAKSIDEPQVDSTGLEDAISPSVVVQERGVELDSENAEAVGAVISPVNEGEGWAEKGNSAAPEAPLEVNQDAATEALSSTEPDEEGASMEAEPSPSDNVEAKPLEEDSAGAGPGADVSLVVEDDGSAAKGDLETAEAPVEAIHPVAEDPSSCALNEDAASLKAATPPSFDVGVRDFELDSDHAGAVIDDVSPVVKDDGWAEKVDIAAPEVPVEADQEVAESSTSAEPDEVVASLEASPSASVRDSEKGIELDSDDVGTVSADDILAAEGEGSTKGGDNAAPEAPVDVNQEVPVAPTSAERDEVVTNLDAESSPSVDDRVNSGEVNSEDARALNKDIGPLIEEGEPGAKGVSEEPEAPVEKVHDGPGAIPSAEPEEEAASLNAVASPAVDMEETSFKVNSEEDEILNENVSLKIKDRVATEKCESVAPNAPVGEVQEVAEATIRPQLDEVAASPEPAPSRSVDVGETSVGGLSEDARATIEDVSHVTKDGGSAEKGFSETLDLPVEEVHDVAEATTSTQPDEAVGSLEAGAPSSVEVQERSDRLDSEDAGAVNENFRPEREAEGSNDESDSESPSVPLEVVEEVEDESTRTEPGQHLANENAVPSPSVDVGVKSNKLDSEGTQAFNEDVGPRIEEEVSAEKGDADAAEVPLEEVHDVAAATSSVEADPDAASLEAAPSPPVDVGDKSVELNSGGAGAESEDANLSEAEGSAKAGGSTGFEAPEKEIKEFAGVAPNVEPEEDAADLDAPPSRSDGLTSVEADAEETGTSSESVSPKIEDEGSAAEKGESEAPVPAEEVNEVAKPKSTAEPLEAAPSTIANVEEKSFEPDPEVARAVSEDVSPEIEDEGLAEKGGSEAAQAPVEEVHEVAEAATSAEPLEAAPSPLVDVEEKPFELSSEIARALNVDASPDTKAEGSAAEKGEREASVPPEEVNEVAEPSIAEPLEAAPSTIANVEEKSLEVDPEVAPSVSGDVSSETEDEGSAEKGDSAVPEDEVPEVTEAKTNAEPDEDVATLEAAPSPAADVGEEPLELGSEVARPLSVDVSPKIEAEGSAAENGDSKASAAPEKINEDTEPSSVAEPLETAPSPVVDVGEESVELDSEDAVASGEEVSPELEVVGSAEEGDSDSPDAPVEEANEVADAAAHVEPEETVASHEGVPSSSTEFGEQVVDVDDKSVDLADETVGIKDKSVEVSSGDVGAVSEELPAEAAASDEVSRTIADEQSAETGGSEAAESPVEEVHEVAEAATSAEPDEDVAIQEAAPSSFVDAEEKPLELDSEVARALSVDASPETEAEGSAAEKGDSTVPEEEVHELKEATTNAEPDEDVATLEAAPSPAVSVEEKPLELGSEVARALSVDATSDAEAEESAAEKGGSEAPEAPVEEVNEVAEPITVAQPLEAAPSPFVDVEDRSLELDPEVAGTVSEDVSPEIEDEGSAEKGDSTVPEDEIHEITEAATNAEPDEDVATLEAAPSHVADVEEKSFKLDPGVAPAVCQDLSAENEGEGSAKKGDNEASEALAEEVREVAETATSAEPDEDVATLEAAPLPFVDVKVEPLEMVSEVARALRVDGSPDIEDEGSAAKKGESGASDPAEEVNEVAEPISIAEPLEAAPSPFANVENKSFELDPEVAPAGNEDVSPKTEDEESAEKGDSAVPEEEVHEVKEAATNAEPFEDVATLEAAPSPAVSVEEKPLELGSEVSRALSVNAGPKVEAEGLAVDKDETKAPEAPVEEINEVSEPITVAKPLEAAPSPFANMGEKSLELDPEVAGTVSEDVSPEIEGEGSAEKGDSAVPEDEIHEITEAATDAEHDEDGATLEAAPSRVADVEEKSFELNPKVAGAVSEDASPKIEYEGSAKKGDNEAPEAPAEEVREVADAATSAEPNEDVATLEAASSPFVDVKEEPLELGSEVARALSVDASPETEAEVSSAETGDSAVPEEVVHELKEATTNAEPDEDVETLEAAPSPTFNVEEKPLELGSEVARALNVDATPNTEAEGSAAEKGESEAPEAPLEVVNEVAEPTPVAEPLEAAPSTIANVEEKSLEVDPEVAPSVSGDVSSETEDEGSAEKGDSAVPEDEVPEVTEAKTNAEPDEDVATLEAAPSPAADVGEEPLELGSEVARPLSVDVSPKIEAEGSAAENGDSKASAAPEKINEDTEPSSVAEPLETAPSPVVDVGEESVELDSEDAVASGEEVSPELEVVGSAEEGDSDSPDAPVEEANEVADAAAHVEPEETVASHEGVPSSSTEFGEQVVDVDDKSVDLADETVGIKDKSVEVSSGDVGAVSEELPAEAAASDEVSRTIADEQSAETGGSEAAESPVEEVHEVAEAATSAEPDEDVAIQEAAPSSFVDAEEKPLELDSEVARALSVDASPETEAEGSAAEKGDSTVPEEEVHELKEATTNAEPDEDVATLEAAPSPAVSVEEKPLELGSEVARALSVDATSDTEAEESAAEKGGSEAPEAPVEEVNQVAEPITIAELLEAAPSPSSEDVSPETEDEESAEKGDREVPKEEVHELTEATTNAEPEEDVASLETAPSSVANVGEESVKLDPENAVTAGEDVSPEFEVVGSADKGDSDSPDAPVEKANEVVDAAAHVEPEETVASHEGVPSSSTEFGEQVVDVDDKSFDLADKAFGIKDKSVEVCSGDVGAVGEELPAEVGASEEVSPTIPVEESAETGVSEAPEAPAEEVREVAEAPTSAQPDEDVAIQEAAPSPFVDAEEKPLELGSEVARALSVDASPGTEEEGSATKGESETPDTPLEEVHEATEARNSAEADEEGAGVKAELSPIADVEEKSDDVEDKLVDVEDKPAEVQDKSVDVEDRAVEINSEDVGAVSEELPAEVATSEEVSPKTPDEASDEESAKTGDSEAPEATAEEVREVAEAGISAKPDDDVATLEAAPSSFVDAEEKPLELDSEIARALSVDASPVTDAEGSAAEKGDSAVPEEEVHELTEASTNAEPDEDVATLEAAPSAAVSVEERPLEMGSEVARDLSVDVSSKFEDEEIASLEEVNEVAEPIASAEPLEVAPSPFADVEEKYSERDPEVGRPLSEDISPKIADEGLAAENGDNDTPEAPVEEVNEVAQAATEIEPDEARASLETVPSPSAEVEDKFADVDEKSVDTDNKAVAVEPKPADVADRSGDTEDVTFSKEDLHAEDPANVEESPKTLDEGSAEQGESEVHDAPLEEGHEVAEAPIDAEPDARVASLEAMLSPSVHAGGTSAQPESEDAVAVGDDVSPHFEDGESGENGVSEAPEASVEEVREIPDVPTSAEHDEVEASLDAGRSPSVNAGEWDIELDSEEAGALNEDISPTIEDCGSVERGDSEARETPLEEVHEVAAATFTVGADPDAASLEAAPSPPVDVGDKSVELNSGGAGAESEDANLSEAEGSAKAGGSTGFEAPEKEIKEFAGVAPNVEPEEDAADLDAPPSRSDGLTSVEADAEETGTSSESVSPKIEDEGSVAEKGESETPAPVEQMNEVAEAATDVEPNKAIGSLETMPSPSAEVEEKNLDVDDESVDIDNKPAAVEPKPADVTDRSGTIGDIAFAKEDLHAEDPAIAEEHPKILDQGSAEQGESDVHDAPVEEDHEVAEAATNAEPDARVASLEATPSPSAHAGGTSAQPDSEDALALGDDVSPQFGDGESGEKGESEAPEARVEEVQEVAEATTGAEPAENASRLDSAISPSLDARERGVELDSEDLRAAASVDVSRNLEDEVLADEGNSAAPEACVEEVRELLDVTTIAWHDEVEESLDAEPSASVNAGERELELDSQEAGAVSDAVRPVIKDEELARKGDSAVPEAPVEVDQDVAKSSTSAEPDEVGASLDAKPLPCIDEGVTSIEPDSEESRALNESSSPLIEAGGSVEEGNPEAAEAPLEQIREVAKASSNAEPDIINGASLEAAISPSFGAIERGIELDSEDTGVASEDASSQCKDGGSAKQGDSTEAAGAHGEEVQEISVATTSAEPGGDAASEPAIAPNVDTGVEGTTGNGEGDTPDVPAGGVGEVAEAAIHVDPGERAAALEAVPSPSAEVEEKYVHAEENSVDAESKPIDIDYKPRDALLHNSVGNDDKIVEMKSGDVGVVRDESPAEVPAIEDVSPPFPNDGLTEKGYGGAPPAPVEVANEVVGATTPVERNEAVASREAAAPYAVDVWERYFEQDSTEAGALNEDLGSQIEDGGMAKKGDSVAAAEAPLEKLHEVADVPTSAKADEFATSVEAAPSPSLDIGEKFVGSEVADDVSKNVSPVTKDEGTAENVEPGDVADKSNEIAEVNSAILQAAPPHSVDERGRSVVLDSKDAGVLNEDVNRQAESSVSAKKRDNEGTAREAPAEEVSEVITTSESEPDDAVANLKAVDVREKSSEVRSEDAKAVSKDASRRPRKFRWMWWGLGTVVLSVFAASLFAFFSGQTGGLAVPFQVLPFLP